MITQALNSICREWAYVLIAVIVALFVFVLATWLPNLGLIWQIATSPSVSLLDKVDILASLVGSIATNFTVFSGLYTTAIAVLFGLNAAMVTYYVKQRTRLSRQTGQVTAAAGFGGLASGFFGIGCAACGTFVLGPVLSFVGATGLVALLPFQGQEFGLLGIAMLGFSNFLVAKKIRESVVCPIVVDGGRATTGNASNFTSTGGEVPVGQQIEFSRTLGSNCARRPE